MYFPRALSVLTQAFFFFWTFRWFLDLISAKLASIWSKMHKFATRQLAFLATSIAFYDILTWTYAEIKILRAARCSGRTFCSEFFTQPFWAFLCISQAPFGKITLIWASLERSFPPAEVEYRWCQFWSKLMTSEVEERPRFLAVGYGWHRSQWVKQLRHHLYLSNWKWKFDGPVVQWASEINFFSLVVSEIKK